jgi:hypothetical protein
MPVVRSTPFALSTVIPEAAQRLSGIHPAF